MGITAFFRPVDADESEEIQSDPDSLDEFLFPEDVEDPFEGQTNIEKSWHSLHFVFTGTMEPDGSVLGDAILGGAPIGPDLGYGAARLIDATRVKVIAKALREIDFDEAFDAADRTSPLLKEIYLADDLSEGERHYLAPHFSALQAMYNQAATDGHTVLAYLA